MENVNYDPPFLQHVVSAHLLGDATFTLIDVGCALGIDPAWRLFGPHLRAYGFDPQSDECERLQSHEESPHVRYIPSFVGLGEDHEFVRGVAADSTRTQNYWNAFPRVSAMAALVQQQPRPQSEHDQAAAAMLDWRARTATAGKVSLSGFASENGLDSIDFIKIDTDGTDLEVAISAESTFSQCGVLGFMIETNFVGSYSDHSNTMHNIDRFMRRHGFMPYNMTVNRYTRTALPGEFAIRGPYQTKWGQPMWGDFVYLRDGAADDYLEIWHEQLSIPKLLKLACLYELFQLPDCAAELIIAHRDRLSAVCDTALLLDLLTPAFKGSRLDYAHYVALFQQSFKNFFPIETATLDGQAQTADGVDQLAQELSALKTRMGATEAELTDVRLALEAAEAQLAYIRRMPIWRVGSTYFRIIRRVRNATRRLLGRSYS